MLDIGVMIWPQTRRLCQYMTLYSDIIVREEIYIFQRRSHFLTLSTQVFPAYVEKAQTGDLEHLASPFQPRSLKPRGQVGRIPSCIRHLVMTPPFFLHCIAAPVLLPCSPCHCLARGV